MFCFISDFFGGVQTISARHAKVVVDFASLQQHEGNLQNKFMQLIAKATMETDPTRRHKIAVALSRRAINDIARRAQEIYAVCDCGCIGARQICHSFLFSNTW